MKMTQLCINTK